MGGWAQGSNRLPVLEKWGEEEENLALGQSPNVGAEAWL